MKKNLFSTLFHKMSTGQGMNEQRGTMDVPKVELTSDAKENCRLVLHELGQPADAALQPLGGPKPAYLLYLRSMVDMKIQQRDVVRPLLGLLAQQGNWDQINSKVSVGQRKAVEELAQAVMLLLEGWTLVAVPGQQGFHAYKTEQPAGRSVEKAENQSIVIGPQDAFTETLDVNLSLIRRRLKTPFLRVRTLQVGELTKTTVAVISLDGITNDEYLQQMVDRVQRVETDGLLDSGALSQLIDDQPLSPFPQFNLVERPDSVAAGLMDGKVALLVDGSPYVCMGPSSFIEFFHSPEDYFNRWMSSSLVRLLRIFGVIVSITFSAIYVAVLTFHYEIIPANMLKTIAQSRAQVPFPPLYEAFFLELTLEVLREAGARLPTKVGQTMGIVGGIVIGQAAVSAGFTSNVMIIVVSLSALASFVTPSYVMGNAVRVVRFPVILASGLWGFIGLSVALVTILIHLLNLASVGAPYMSPFASLRLSDLKDTLVRVPTQLMLFRPAVTKAKRDKRAGGADLNRK